MSRVTGQPGIVLHTRPYRESSLLLTLLTLDHGMVSLVGRGVRGGSRGRALQPFTRLRVSWSGRSSLGTLGAFEADRQFWFGGNVLASAFYLTELISRLLEEREPHPRLFAGLNWALEELESGPAAVLRQFEKLLLEELGYGLDLERDLKGETIVAGRLYRLVPDHGFEPAPQGVDGGVLRKIGEGAFAELEVRRAARGIFAEALAVHLGPRPLVSRSLLVDHG